MISLKRLFTSFIVLNLLIISFASADTDTPPEFPFMALSGNVKIDGNNAPLGTIITAFIVDDSDPTTSDGVTTINENGEYAMLLDDVSEEDVGKEIIFMVMDDNEVHPTYDVGIWVNTPFFASALENLFELAWKNMKPAAEVAKR